MESGDFFKSIDILSDLGPEDIAFLAETAQNVDYPAGTNIIKIGDIGRYLWIVYAGEVDVSLPDETGSQQLIASLERGAFFGEMSILSGEPAVANVTASLDSKIVKVPRAAIRFSIKKVVSKD